MGPATAAPSCRRCTRAGSTVARGANRTQPSSSSGPSALTGVATAPIRCANDCSSACWHGARLTVVVVAVGSNSTAGSVGATIGLMAGVTAGVTAEEAGGVRGLLIAAPLCGCVSSIFERPPLLPPPSPRRTSPFACCVSLSTSFPRKAPENR